MGLRAMEEVRFARGTARIRRWCSVEHRVIDWASHSPFPGESEVVIMIAVVTEEMHRSDRTSDLNGLRASLGWHRQLFSARAKWRSSSSACGSVLKKGLTPPTLSEMPDFANIQFAILGSCPLYVRRSVQCLPLSN